MGNIEILKKCIRCKQEKTLPDFMNEYKHILKKCNECRREIKVRNRYFVTDQNLRQFLEEKIDSSKRKEMEAYTGYLFMEAIA